MGPYECVVPDPAGPHLDPVRAGARRRDPGGRPAPRTDRRRAARRAQRAAARGRRARRSAAARGRRSRLRQDPRADPPDRLADLRAQGPPRLDPGDHVHQQGGRGDARARRGAGRPAGPDHVGLHLPLGVRADPAQGDRPLRLQVVVLDLRLRRLQAADDPGVQGARPRPQALPAPCGAQLDLQPEERAGRPRGRCQEHPEPPRGDVRRGLRALPAEAARGQRPRLRRPDHDDRAPAPGVPGGARDLPPAVPARARRRVPGHQPRAVRPGPRAVRARRRPPGHPRRGRPGRPRRRRHRAVGADGGRRRRPVDLRVPRGQHPQHHGLRGGLPRREHDHAGAELPLHADDPDGGQLGDQPQQGPQGQEPLVGRRRR